MSSNSNIEKNKNYKKLDIIEILDHSKKARIFFLVALGISGLGIRLYFFPYDVPILNDAQGYFWYAIDMSILNQFPPGHSIINNGHLEMHTDFMWHEELSLYRCLNLLIYLNSEF